MQLDRTHVVIRARTLSEIGDLALVMVRRYPAALLVGFAIGITPWAIANWLLLAWIPWREAAYGWEDPEAATELVRYLFWMLTLVILQTPAAGVLTTYYLGQAVFEHQPTWRNTLREVWRQRWRCFRVLGVQRLALPAMAVVALRWGQPAHAFFDTVLPIGLLVAAAAIRSGRPFLPEILLLEQCPFRVTRGTEITVSRRSRALHRPLAGELSGRYLATSFVLLFLALSVYYTLFWGRGIAFGVWRLDLVAILLFYPAAVWCAGGLSVIIRLLGYLDTRIRLEGWEVELAIRAEAMRQFGEDEFGFGSLRPDRRRTRDREGDGGRAGDGTRAGDGAVEVAEVVESDS